jgi:hypothetical protein
VLQKDKSAQVCKYSKILKFFIQNLFLNLIKLSYQVINCAHRHFIRLFTQFPAPKIMKIKSILHFSTVISGMPILFLFLNLCHFPFERHYAKKHYIARDPNTSEPIARVKLNVTQLTSRFATGAAFGARNSNGKRAVVQSALFALRNTFNVHFHLLIPSAQTIYNKVCICAHTQ